jgi:hypothetical protein
MYAEPFSAVGHGGGLNWDGISKIIRIMNLLLIFQIGTRLPI